LVEPGVTFTTGVQSKVRAGNPSEKTYRKKTSTCDSERIIWARQLSHNHSDIALILSHGMVMGMRSTCLIAGLSAVFHRLHKSFKAA